MMHDSDKLEALDRALWNVFVHLENEADSLAVIRAAAFLDDALRRLLESQFANRVSGELLDQGGPLSSFSARAKLALALSLISDENYDDITRIRKLRNDCAHTFKAVDLAVAPFCDRTRELVAWEFWTAEHDRKDRSCTPEQSKARFLLTAAVVAKDIVSPIGATRSLTPSESREFWRSIFRKHEDASE